MIKRVVLCYSLILSGLLSAAYQTDKMIITSIPKCGTHLLARGLQLMFGRPIANLSFMSTGPQAVLNDKIPPTPKNEIFLDHIPYSAQAAGVVKKRGIKGFFIYRDPRDQVVSMAYHIIANPDAYKEFADLIRSSNRISLIITKLIGQVDAHYRKFLPWKNDANFLTLRFEDLIGVSGGGLAKSQRECFNKIAKHAGMKLDNKVLTYVTKNIYGNTGTFREGKIGSWKKHFTSVQRTLFKQKAGKLLIDLGYERAMNW